MKRPLEAAQRWFRQAEHDLQTAKLLLKKSPADSCYFSEQTSQKALKAFLYRRGSRGQWEHSIAILAKRCSKIDAVFRRFVEYGGILDQFYIPTRYPDALADPAVPFESYSVEQAKEAIRLSTEILEAVRAKL